MPKSIPFTLLKIFENKYTLDKYVSKLPPFSIYKSNKVKNCHICNSEECEMKVQYIFCTSEYCNTSNTPICPCRYKIEICEKIQTIYFSKAFEHLFDHSTRKDCTRRHGLTPQAKEIAEQIIFHHGITKPNRIQSTMHDKFRDLIDHMPTLKQVQNYCKTRRKKVVLNNYRPGEENNFETDKISVISISSNDTSKSNDNFFSGENLSLTPSSSQKNNIEFFSTNAKLFNFGQDFHLKSENFDPNDESDSSSSDNLTGPSNNPAMQQNYENHFNPIFYGNNPDENNNNNPCFNLNTTPILMMPSSMPTGNEHHVALHHYEDFYDEEETLKMSHQTYPNGFLNNNDNNNNNDKNDNYNSENVNKNKRDSLSGGENEGFDDDEIEEVPTSYEAIKMFHGLKRFLSKYTPDSNDVIFDLEKRVNQGIENNKKITKFSFS